jgi:hypothetical protein
LLALLSYVAESYRLPTYVRRASCCAGCAPAALYSVDLSDPSVKSIADAVKKVNPEFRSWTFAHRKWLRGGGLAFSPKF